MGLFDRIAALSGAENARGDREKAEAEAARRQAYLDPWNLISHGDIQGLAQRYNWNSPIDYSDDDSWDKYLVDAGRTMGNAAAHGLVSTGSDFAGIGSYAASKLLGDDSELAKSLNDTSRSIEDWNDQHFDYRSVGDSTADQIANFGGDVASAILPSLALGATGMGAGAAVTRAASAVPRIASAAARLTGTANRLDKAYEAAKGTKAAGVLSSLFGDAGKAASAVGSTLERTPVLGSVARNVGLPSASDLVGGVVSGAMESAGNANQSMNDYIEDAKKNGTYVEGQTEAEAQRVADAVFHDTNFTNIPVSAIEQGIARRNAQKIWNAMSGKGAETAAKKSGGILTDILKGSASEGGQEYAQQIIQDEQGRLGGKATLADYLTEEALTSPDALYAGAVGAAMSPLMVGGARLADRLAGRRNALQEVADESNGAEEYSGELAPGEEPTATATLTRIGGAYGGGLQKSSGDEALDAKIVSVAAQEGVNPNLLSALIEQESGYQQGATSNAGAIGYGQLMPDTAKALGVDPYDSDGNLVGTARYLKQQLDTFGGDVEKALAAYNAGPGAVEEYGGIPPYEETQNYVKSILGKLGGIDISGSGAPAFPGYIAGDDNGQYGFDTRYIGLDYLSAQNINTIGNVQPVTIAGMNALANAYAAETGGGKLYFTSLTGGAHPSNSSKWGHAAGYKADVSTQGIDKDKLIEIADRLGIGLVVEDEGTSNEHFDISFGRSNAEPNSRGTTDKTGTRWLEAYEAAQQNGGVGSAPSYVGSVSVNVPTIDFSRLAETPQSIAHNEKELAKLIGKDGGASMSDEDKEAILTAAQTIRDTPTARTESDPETDAAEYNEWQKLIDTKDYAGLFEKDPERLTRTLMRMDAQKKGSAAEARAKLKEAQDRFAAADVAARKALKGIAKRRPEISRTKVGSTAVNRLDTTAETLPERPFPTQGDMGSSLADGSAEVALPSAQAASEESVPMPETKGAGLRSAQLSKEQLDDMAAQAGFSPLAAPHTTDKPIQQQAQNRKLALAQDRELSHNPLYAQAKKAGDAETATALAEANGKDELAALLRLGAQGGAEVQAAPMVRNSMDAAQATAGAPSALVDAASIVPHVLPADIEARKAIGTELSYILANTDIPLTNNLRGKLLQGSPKAIHYGKKLLDNAMTSGVVTPEQVESARTWAARPEEESDIPAENYAQQRDEKKTASSHGTVAGTPSLEGEEYKNGEISSPTGWIKAHPFQYDAAKSVGENAAIAQRLAREFLDKFGETYEINTDERKALRRRVIEELYGDGAEKKERKAFIVMGLPASGKSSAVAEPLAKENGALIIDSDDAKKKLPEFADGLLAAAVHEESSGIAERVVSRALEKGDNIVLPVVGKTESSLQEKIDLLKSEGYTVELHYVDLPVEKAVERGKARFKETGRLVPLDYIRKVGLKPKENYDKLKVQKGVDHYVEWDNDVAYGRRPRLLEEGPTGLHSKTELAGRGQQLSHQSRVAKEEAGAVPGAGVEAGNGELNNKNRSTEKSGFSMPKNEKSHKLTEEEQEALKGTSKEAQEVFFAVRDKLADSKNPSVSRAAAVSAALFARHADVVAQETERVTGRPYTAMDYYRDTFSLATDENPNGGDALHQAMNYGVNPDVEVAVVDITDAVPNRSKDASNKELLEYVRDLAKKDGGTMSADQLAVLGVKRSNAKHITYSSFKPKSNRKYKIRVGALKSIKDLMAHSVLVESVPNRKAYKRNKVRAYHRFYVPVRVGNKVETIRIVAEERNGAITINPAQVDLYDVVVESKKGAPPVATALNGAHINTGNAPSRITIREMLSDVKDADGKMYIGGDGIHTDEDATKPYGDFTQKAVESQKDAVRAQYEGTKQWMKAPNGKPTNLTEDQWLVVRTPAFKEWFGDWERRSAAEEIQSMPPKSVKLTGKPLDKKAAEAVVAKFAPAVNERYGTYATFPKSMVGKIVRHKGFDVSQMIEALPDLFSSSVLAFEEPAYTKEGHKDHPNVKAYHHYVNKFKAGGKTYYIRFSCMEEKTKSPRKRSLRRQLHSTGISDVEIYEAKKKGVPSQRIRVMDPGEESKTPFIDFRLAEFFDSVKAVSTVVDENGEPKVVHHGTQRKDRVGNEFRKDRATSGPMAFFTDSRKVAEGYANKKVDTSLEDIPYEDRFRLKTKKGNQPLYETWDTLSSAKQREITEKARHVVLDSDYNIVYNPSKSNGLGNYQQELRRARGNAIRALEENWLNEGVLEEDDHAAFLDVLKLVGIDETSFKGLYYADPNFTDAGVFDVFMDMKKPFDPSKNLSKLFLRRLRAAAKRAPEADSDGGMGPWDKRAIEPSEFVKNVESDIKDGTSYAWISIPDWVTELLQKMGYDGIRDEGGKNGGVTHTVYIPFEPTQIKSVDNNGAFSAEDANIFYQSAWHGSPYDFDKFDLEHIGRGEGVQAHGWGLYFAANRGTSSKYKEVLSESQGYTVRYKGHIYNADGVDESGQRTENKALRTIASMLRWEKGKKGLDEVEARIQKVKEEAKEGSSGQKLAEECLKLLHSGDFSFDRVTNGKLYEVDIPENDVLLDEQKKFSSQPLKVRKAITKYIKDAFPQYHSAERDGEYILYCGDEEVDRYDDEDAIQQAVDENNEFVQEVRDKKFGDIERMTGRDIYMAIEGNEHSAHKASEVLNGYGVKGITYLGSMDDRCYVVFDDKSIDILEKFDQQLRQAVKGSVRNLPNGKRVVSLFQSADESTFLHEMGHVFLMDLESLAPMSEESARDLKTVEDWARWKSGQVDEYKGSPFAVEFAKLDKDIRAALKKGDEVTGRRLMRQWEQERFARGFEMYLKTADAPTSALARVFARFKKFLARVYSAFKGAGGKATPEVERVMARMLGAEANLSATKSGDTIRGKTGKTVEITTDDGTPIKAKYRVVMRRDLIPSHTFTGSGFSINAKYPKELQPRDRGRVTMGLQVTKMANALRPADLAASRNLNQGAPVIRPDGVVLNGNGRTLALSYAYQKGNPSIRAYKKYLAEHAEEFGYTKKDMERLVKGNGEPILVRVVDAEDAKTVGDIIHSTAGGARMGAEEQATADAEKLKQEDFDDYVPNERGDLMTTANRDFMNGVLYRIVPQQEQNAYTDKRGVINVDGVARVKRALFAKAYHDSGLISRMAESTDDETRNVTNGLTMAAPILARMDAEMKKGRIHDYPVSDTIIEAVNRYAGLKAEDKPVEKYLSEQNMFSEYEDTPEMQDMLRIINEFRRSGKKLGTFFGHLGQLVEAQGNPNQLSLIDSEPVSLQELIANARTFVENGGDLTGTEQPGLLSEEFAQRDIDRANKEGDNETRVSDRVFQKYLNPGIMDMVEETVSKEIGEYVDLSQMSDPVARDKARDSLPYIRKMLTHYNILKAQKAKVEILNRYAVKVEYARRCFDNDDRIRREAVRAVGQHDGQSNVGETRNADYAEPLQAGGREGGRRSISGVSRSVSGEKSGAHEHFQKLYDEESRSEMDGFSSAENKPLSKEEEEFFQQDSSGEVREEGERLYGDLLNKEPAGSPGRIRKALDHVAGAAHPTEGVTVRDTRGTAVREIGAKQVDRFIRDKKLQKSDIISLTKKPNGKVEIRYKSKDAGNIGLIDQIKTPRQLARKNPFVKAIYDLGNKAIHRQEHLRNKFNETVREFVNLTKNKDDLEEVTSIILQSDAEGKNYTAKELKEMGVSNRAARAYLLTRKELDRAYKILNDARMQVKTRTKKLPEAELTSFKESHWIAPEDVQSEQLQEDGSILLTWRGRKTYDTAAEHVTGEALDLMRRDDDINIVSVRPLKEGVYGKNMFSVSYVERIKPIANRKGYFPHFFHEFMVYEAKRGKDGEEILTTVGSGRTLNDAVKLGNEMEKRNPGKHYVVQPKAFDMGGGDTIVIGDKDFGKMASKIAKETEMSLSDARAFLQDKGGASLKSRHRFFGNMMQRKGAKGFETDVTWALQHYLNAAARYVAMEEFKPQAISMYERWFGAFDKDPDSLKGTRGATAKYVKHMIQDINGTPRQVETVLSELVNKTPLGKWIADTYGDRTILAVNGELSTWNAITKLGLGNVASAAVNFSQFINVGTAMNDYGAAADGLRRSIHPSEEDAKILEESGIMDDINQAADNGGYTQRRSSGRVGGLYSRAKAFGEWTLKPFQYCDTLMRKAAILGAYHQGVKKLGLTHEAALERAKDINNDANFDYSSGNAPGVFRAGSVLTQQLFQFQKYPIMQFEFMYNIMKNGTRGQKVRFLLPFVLLAGIPSAIPFGELFNKLFSFLLGIATGKDEDIERDIRASAIRWAGKDPLKRALVETSIYGVLAPAFGVDISSRIGVSNAFSGEFYGEKPESIAGIVAEQMGGPAVSTALNLLKQSNNGNPVEMLKAVSPALGNMAQAAAGESRTTHHRVKSRYEDAYGRIIHALGFRSLQESNESFVINYEYERKQQETEEKKDAIQSYIENSNAENKARLKALGIREKQVKEAQISQERTAKERATLGRPSTSGRPKKQQKKNKDTLFDTLDE